MPETSKKITITQRSETGGVFAYKEYPAYAQMECAPWDGVTELWVEYGAQLEKHVAAPGGTMEISSC